MRSDPRLATAKAIQDLRADRRSGRGWNVVPNPASSLTACTSACSACAGAITVVMPDHVAMRAAASFEAMPPLPTPERLAPATSTSSVSKAVTSSINVAVGSRRGSAVKRPGGVGQEHEVRRADEVRHQRRQAVVVAEADLLVGHGVVLVHDRHDVQCVQRLERAARVQVLTAVGEVERREQDLTDARAELGEGVAPRVHQERLTHGRDGLQGDAVGRTRSTLPHLGPTGGDRAGGHDDDGPALRAQVDHVVGDARPAPRRRRRLRRRSPRTCRS